MFFHWQPDGGLVATAASFPDWRFSSAVDDRVSRAAAEKSLRDHVARELQVSKYEIPRANQQFAARAA